MNQRFYSMLLDVLRLAALPAEDQVRMLPDFAVVTDEILTDYDFVYCAVPQLVEAHLVPASALPALVNLEYFFAVLPDEPEPTVTESLYRNQYWMQGRQLAHSAETQPRSSGRGTRRSQAAQPPASTSPWPLPARDG